MIEQALRIQVCLLVALAAMGCATIGDRTEDPALIYECIDIGLQRTTIGELWGKPVWEEGEVAYYFAPSKMDCTIMNAPGCIMLTFSNNCVASKRFLCLRNGSMHITFDDWDGQLFWIGGCRATYQYYVNSEGKEVIHGKLTYWRSDRKWQEWSIQHGQRQGQYTRWHENGRKRMVCFYADDKREGSVMWWDTRGNVLAQGVYKNDKPWSGTFVTVYSGAGRFAGRRAVIDVFKTGFKIGRMHIVVDEGLGRDWSP